MAPINITPAGLAAEAINGRRGVAGFDLYLGPEGDYLRLRGHAPPHADISVTCAGVPSGRYSAQICLENDPLNIVYDGECNLPELLRLCDCYLGCGADI